MAGITIPHQSQAGISVAHGGQAAQYRSTRDFMTPGQENLGRGMQQLAAGMEKLGGTLFDAEIQKRQTQIATDLLADEVSEKDAYRAFRAEYEKSHQGADAREASAATDEYFKERMGGLQKKWGGNPPLWQAVQKMMSPIRTGGMDRAVGYSAQQEMAHMQGVSELAFGETLRDFADPSKTNQELGASLGSYESSLRAMHGQRFDPQTGQWAGGIPEAVDAKLASAKEKLYSERAESLIASGRLGDARAFVKSNARELGGKASNFTEKIAAEGKRRESEYLATMTDAKAMSFVGRLEAGDDESEIMKDILSLPKKERGPVNALYRSYRAVLKEAQTEKKQEGVMGNRAAMDSMSPGEAFVFVEALPERTWVDRQIKSQAQADYSVMAAHAGLKKTTNPDAYSALVDAMSYPDEPNGIRSEKDLRAHPEAAKVAKGDMDKLANDLKGASVIKDTDLKTAFRWAIGKDESTPEGGTLNSREKADFLAFSEWANTQAKNSNRAKEPEYVKEIARQWRMKGETPSKFGIGYGGDAPFAKAAGDPQWLPDLVPADRTRISNLFKENPEGAKVWLGRYGNDRESAMRGYLKYELEQARGPRRRETAQ